MPTQVLGSAAGYAFQEWLRGQVRSDERAPARPQAASDVAAYQQAVRVHLAAAAGPKPEYTPLRAMIHQVQRREGYRVEAVSFPTFDGLIMTANTYVPDAEAPVPGVLVVHGHWPHGRRDPQVQARCLALVKSGYFVLAVDAFGAGERAVALPGAYHGALDGAALWLVGRSLFSIQIHENLRACDYLASRPEVDAARLAITGASGGGNQAFYSGAWDERFQVVVPVCAAGSYRQMIAASNCVCETPPGLAAALEQADLYALIAPRALLAMNAKSDSLTFWHEEAETTIAEAARVWGLLGAPERVAYQAFPTTHGYWRPQREALLGWLDRWLRGAPSAEPRPEPAFEVEDLVSISCFPNAVEPQVPTVRRHFAARRDAAAAERPRPTRERLAELLQVPAATAEMRIERLTRHASGLGLAFHTHAGLMLPGLALWSGYDQPERELLIRIGETKEEAVGCAVVRAAHERGLMVWSLDLPGLGEAALPQEMQRNDLALNHNAARSCYMLGFNLAGLRLRLLRDIVATARRLGFASIALFATGTPADTVLMGASLLDQVDRLLIRGATASFHLGDTFERRSMELFVPGLAALGDLPELAALRAPQPLTIAAPVDPCGGSLDVAAREACFTATRAAYAAAGAAQAFRLLGAEEVEAGLGRWL